MKIRIISLLIVSLVCIFPDSAFGQVSQGSSCKVLGTSQNLNGYKYTCIKAPRSLSNPLGKKLIWSKGTLVPTLESARNSSERLSALNSLGLGVWKQTDSQGFRAQVFMSTWPCIIYMANDLNSAVEIFNNKVNINFYGGFWLGVQSKNWVINQPSRDDRTCVQYFSRNYGGRIYNGNIQAYDY